MKFKILLTASKLLAYLIYIEGFVYGILNKDPSVLMFTVTMSTGLMGFKTGMTTLTKVKGIEETPAE